jgi:hypothetical protein
MNNEVDRRGCGLILGTVFLFAWEDSKTMINLSMKVSVSVTFRLVVKALPLGPTCKVSLSASATATGT